MTPSTESAGELLAAAKSMSREQLNELISSLTNLAIPSSAIPAIDENPEQVPPGSSQFYVPRPARLPGFPDPPPDAWGAWDEYRDDLDPGYRIRDLHPGPVVPSVMPQLMSVTNAGYDGHDDDELLSARSGGTSLSNTGRFPVGLVSLAPNSPRTNNPLQPAPLSVPLQPAEAAARFESPAFGRPDSPVELSAPMTARFDIFGAREVLPLRPVPAAPAGPGASAASAAADMGSLQLRVEYERGKSGLEAERDRALEAGERLGARYEVREPLGSGAFSTAYAARVLLAMGAAGTSERQQRQEEEVVCVKVVKNVKDFFDQGLDEIRVLLHLETAARRRGSSLRGERIVELRDFFYFREHLCIVTEKLGENLYEYQRFCKSQNIKYFTLGRVQRIAHQLVRALSFIHNEQVISCDLKPENVLFESYSACLVRVIDFGNACYTTEPNTSTYIQSRCYRAPEIILGLPHWTHKVDIWSLGAVLAELFTGYVLFQCERVEGMLARIVGIIGEFPDWMLEQGRFVSKLFINKTDIRDENNILVPKKTSLWQRLRSQDAAFVDFVCRCLQLDPQLRASAAELQNHEFLQEGRFLDGL